MIACRCNAAQSIYGNSIFASLKSNEITSIPLTDALGVNKKVDDVLISVALSLHDKLGGEKSQAHVITST